MPQPQTEGYKLHRLKLRKPLRKRILKLLDGSNSQISAVAESYVKGVLGIDLKTFVKKIKTEEREFLGSRKKVSKI